MKEVVIYEDAAAKGGFTSGGEGIWTRGAADAPPVRDYIALGERLGFPLSRVARPYQAGGELAAIAGADCGGCGVLRDSVFKRVDGLVTRERGLVLSVLAADCVPVYLVEPDAGVIGLLHCGWRSAAGELIAGAVGLMKSLGAVPARIKACVGPRIGAEDYEVGEEVREKFAKSVPQEELAKIFEARGGRLFLDLAGAVRLKAERAGIAPENVSASGINVFADEGFYSYRRGDGARQNLAYLYLKP